MQSVSPFFVLVQVSENGFAQYIQFGRMTNYDMLFELIMFSDRISIFLFLSIQFLYSVPF